MKQASTEAYAKINLTLDVTGKRPNGYHDVCMVMQSIGIHDIVTVQTETGADDIELTISHCDLPTDSSNLAYRAAQLFLQRTNKQSDGIRIHIEKHNPIAAGLAGGSTDAAAVLVLLNDLYQTGLTQEQLMEMGLALGADVPFCIAGGTMLAEGIGEVLTPLPHAPQAFVVLCKPPSCGIDTGHLSSHRQRRHCTPSGHAGDAARAERRRPASGLCTAVQRHAAGHSEHASGD